MDWRFYIYPSSDVVHTEMEFLIPLSMCEKAFCLSTFVNVQCDNSAHVPL